MSSAPGSEASVGTATGSTAPSKQIIRSIGIGTLLTLCFRALSVPKAVAAKRVSQILLAVEYLEGNRALSLQHYIVSSRLLLRPGQPGVEVEFAGRKSRLSGH